VYSRLNIIDPTCANVLFPVPTVPIIPERIPILKLSTMKVKTSLAGVLCMLSFENRIMKLIITFIVIVVSACSLYAQHKTIKGRVITDDFETLPLASIMINDTVEAGRTDLNGFFQIEIPVYTNKLLLFFVGIEPAKIVLAGNCDEVEIVMMLRSTYDFITLKKADRLRMKGFKKLPALHKAAFAKGIFKTDKACYTQEFIPYYKKK
jgi:hypothetical protein